MPKIKLTKTELKTQQDALKQYSRFLPTLQLKKQQLQVEMRLSAERLRQNEEEQEQLHRGLESWVAMFGTPDAVELLSGLVDLKHVNSEISNIAGVNVPVFKDAVFSIAEYNLFREDSWIADAVEVLKKMLSLLEAHKILEEQARLLAKELRTTTQRVNLFEKIKIPECKENIRFIRIYLGDIDTAGVARSKIAKRKGQEAAA
ncbi:MAG: V-type ATP synthase subunit D [Victivallaceae bacterium]